MHSATSWGGGGTNAAFPGRLPPIQFCDRRNSPGDDVIHGDARSLLQFEQKKVRERRQRAPSICDDSTASFRNIAVEEQVGVAK